MKTVCRPLLPLLLALAVLAWSGAVLADPLADTPTDLNVAFIRSAAFTTDMNEVLAVKQFEAETNVRLVWEEIPEGNAAEKVNLKFASNDMPDAFMNCGINADMQANYGMKQGMLAPLNSLIAQYAPTIQALLESRPDLAKEIKSADGNIYAMPQLNEVIWNANPDNLFINTIWLEKLGLEMPETPEAFVEVLRAFKAGDPNGNGQADEIPLSFCYGRGAANDMQSLTGFFGAIDSAYNRHIAIEGGKLSLAATAEGTKQALQWLHGLYAEGLIDIEAFTQETAQMSAKGMAETELLGCFVSFNPDTVVPYAAAYDHYEPVLPLRAADGSRLWARNAPPYGLNQGAFAIASSSEKQALAIRWLDYVNTEDNLYVLRWGPFGVSVERTEEGKVDIAKHNQPPEGSGLTSMQFHHKNTLGNFAPYLLDAQRVETVQWGLIQAKKLERYFAYEPYLQAEVLPNTIQKYMTEGEVKELSTLGTNVDSTINQTKATLIVNGFTDADWDSFVAKLKDMGADRYVEIYQNAYDRYLE